MRQGVSDYLAKPVDVRTLMASVANAIAQEQFSWA
jgi:FixJ family two-component response regulator